MAKNMNLGSYIQALWESEPDKEAKTIEALTIPPITAAEIIEAKLFIALKQSNYFSGKTWEELKGDFANYSHEVICSALVSYKEFDLKSKSILEKLRDAENIKKGLEKQKHITLNNPWKIIISNVFIDVYKKIYQVKELSDNCFQETQIQYKKIEDQDKTSEQNIKEQNKSRILTTIAYLNDSKMREKSPDQYFYSLKLVLDHYDVLGAHTKIDEVGEIESLRETLFKDYKQYLLKRRISIKYDPIVDFIIKNHNDKQDIGHDIAVDEISASLKPAIMLGVLTIMEIAAAAYVSSDLLKKVINSRSLIFNLEGAAFTTSIVSFISLFAYSLASIADNQSNEFKNKLLPEPRIIKRVNSSGETEFTKKELLAELGNNFSKFFLTFTLFASMGAKFSLLNYTKNSLLNEGNYPIGNMASMFLNSKSILKLTLMLGFASAMLGIFKLNYQYRENIGPTEKSEHWAMKVKYFNPKPLFGKAK